MMTPTDAAWVLPGLLLGGLHFHSLRRNADLYMAGSTRPAIALHIARMALTLCGFLLVAWQGSWPLLLAAAGFLLARLLLVRPASAQGEE
ncbi:ATP synthase subunit I [Roseomonas chloroacetimidivorans]|uniref:N-ATPase subunit AtpR n=1 Tax=Roseomonas chloroacetimidivorans TaxID=1766656 RepID=UPI003C72083B